MDRTPGMIVGAIIACLPLLAQSGPGQPPSTESSAPKTTEQAFKNIQVLKGIPADQLIPSMQFITSSLGVGCDFCHVKDRPDQDDKKPKQIARKMMQMTMAINQNNFEGHRDVTCNTCHRGAARPVGIPAIGIDNDRPRAEMPEAMEPEEQLSPGLPSADQVLEKYVQALGGAKAMERILTRVAKGTASFAGHDVAVDVFDKAPGKRLSIMHLPEGDSITAFDGQEGWLASPGRPIREMHGAEIDAARMDADLQFPIHLKQMFREWKVARPEKIGDRETYQLVATNSGQPPLRLYFDEQSGLLVRLVRYADSALGLNPTQIDYADYRDVSGVKIPYRWTIARPAGQFTIQATEIQHNVSIDDKRFVKPAEPTEAEGRPSQ
jgi:hypothetical protein